MKKKSITEESGTLLLQIKAILLVSLIGLLGYWMLVTFYPLAVMLAGAVLFAAGWDKFNLKRMIEDLPSSTPGAVAMGLVEVKGTIQNREDLYAPVRGKKCVCYELEVVPVRDGRTVNSAAAKWSGHKPFYISDGRGSCVVFPTSAVWHIGKGSNYEFRNPEDIPASLLEFLAHKGDAHKCFCGQG
ncbi:MAG: hypothetical protein PHQ23_17480, partial [Candidatus Wallbacteria bacterium]|nr:hypothetical protein [Candidatus Wallbacteria bacterium]